MKKYIKPEVQEVVCANNLCEMITMSADSSRTTGNNWSREEEELFWDEEQGW